MKHNIKLGTDPEIFIENETEIVSAVGLIPGTKSEPHPISDKGHCIQTDNIAFEFNIPACDNADDYVENINYVKEYLDVIAKAHGFKLSTKASDEINPIHLQSEQAQVFGCEPDFNVYLEDMNPSPNSNTNLRCVGGHVHIGYDNPNQSQSVNIVKMFDIFVTLPSLLIDNDERRRELYGKAGSFRFKDFGVECRQLSNFWIHDDTLIKWVFNQTIKAVSCVLENKHTYYLDKYSTQVVQAIDNNDKKLAKLLLTQIKKDNYILTN
jgi:hypothetical protein